MLAEPVAVHPDDRLEASRGPGNLYKPTKPRHTPLPHITMMLQWVDKRSVNLSLELLGLREGKRYVP